MANESGTSRRTPVKVRRYGDADARQVLSLHQRVFPGVLPPDMSEAQFQSHMKELSVTNPWRIEDIGPLVVEDESGKIIGFHNVQPRGFLFRGRSARAAVCSAMCIDPDYRGYAGAEMLKHMLSGPQDLSISDDANEVAAHVAVHMGCSIYQLQSIRWAIPLRPANLALAMVLSRIGLPRAHWVGAGIPTVCDAIFKRLPKSPVRVPAQSSLVPRPLDIDEIAASLPRASRGYSLRVDHNRESVAWMLNRGHRMTQAGEPRSVMVCEQDGSAAGWFTYHLHKHGLADVVQFVSRLRFRQAVFDWLIRDAMQSGAAGLTGRLEPDLLEIVAGHHALLQPQSHWVVVHSRNPEYVQTFMAGGALLSRLEGEWNNGYPYSASPANLTTDTKSDPANRN